MKIQVNVGIKSSLMLKKNIKTQVNFGMKFIVFFSNSDSWAEEYESERGTIYVT